MQVRRILFLALFASTFVYLGVAVVAPPRVEVPPEPILLYVLYAVSLGLAVASFVVPARLARTTLLGLALPVTPAPNFGDLPAGTLTFDDPDGARRRAASGMFVPTILTLALREAIAINGLLLAFMGFPLPLALPMFCLAWLTMPFAFPRESQDDALLEAAYGAVLPKRT